MNTRKKKSEITLASDIYARRLVNKEDITRWYLKERSARVSKALERHGFSVSIVDTKVEARNVILNLIPIGASIGIGGSMTIRELDILSDLEKTGHILYDHWKPGLTQEQVLDIRRAQLTCDVFLTSVNALSSDGQLVCCDGVGNRVSAITFGPRKVIIAIGANKIVKDLEEAIRRVRDVAAPRALRDTGLEVPCVNTGSCQDCDSAQRGCRVTLIMERKPVSTDITVVLISEPLGF